MDKCDRRVYINKGKWLAAKERFNLLSGRAVNKDVVLKSGEKADMRLKLDFSEYDVKKGYAVKNYGENYGFNLSTAVDKFVILDIDKPDFN